MRNIKNKFYHFVLMFSLMVCTQLSFAKPIYRCVIGAETIYQHSPCAEIKTQKVACANYWGGLDFEDTEEANCLKSKHGESGFSYSENSSGYGESLSSIHSSRSSYSSGRAKTQRVSGYTRKDGTRVKSHMRSRKR
jgi:hypothetical protein